MRRLLFLLKLLLFFGAVTPNVFEFDVPNVENMAVNFENVADVDSFTSFNFDEELTQRAHYRDMSLEEWPMSAFRSKDFQLTSFDLDYAKNTFKGVSATPSQWKKFNEMGDWEELSGDRADVYRAFAFRRAVINESLLKPGNRGGDFAIKWFDDYQMYINCHDKEEGHHSSDVSFENRGFHYVKFNYRCFIAPCEVSELHQPYLTQGLHLDELKGIFLRVVDKWGQSKGKKAKIHNWRTFRGCETNEYKQQIVPDFGALLDEVGLAFFDRKYEGDFKPKAALQLFGIELYRKHRKAIPGVTKEKLEELERTEREALKKIVMSKLVDEGVVHVKLLDDDYDDYDRFDPYKQIPKKN